MLSFGLSENIRRRKDYLRQSSKMFGFTESFRELTIACKDAIDYLTALPECGDPEDIDFRFGPPKKGKLPFYIVRNGRSHLLGNLCDCYPPFEKMKGWMERSITRSAIGNFSTEILNLDCEGYSMMLVLAQSDWSLFPCGNGGKKLRPVSVLLILRSGMDTPMVLCFCRTDLTISNLYRALSDVLIRYGSRFDNPQNWFPYNRKWIGMHKWKTSELIMEQIGSKSLEIFEEFSVIDDMRQKRTIPL